MLKLCVLNFHLRSNSQKLSVFLGLNFSKEAEWQSLPSAINVTAVKNHCYIYGYCLFVDL